MNGASKLLNQSAIASSERWTKVFSSSRYWSRSCSLFTYLKRHENERTLSTKKRHENERTLWTNFITRSDTRMNQGRVVKRMYSTSSGQTKKKLHTSRYPLKLVNCLVRHFDCRMLTGRFDVDDFWRVELCARNGNISFEDTLLCDKLFFFVSTQNLGATWPAAARVFPQVIHYMYSSSCRDVKNSPRILRLYTEIRLGLGLISGFNSGKG